METQFGPIKRIIIAYFSGTGSTARVADCFEQTFRNHRTDVEKYQINAGISNFSTTGKGDLLLLLYAVHALNAPEPVHQWIASLPQGQGMPVAVVSVSGGGEISPNTACRVGSIGRLSKKGYNVVYEQMLVMPSNVAFKTHDGLAIRLLDILPSKVEQIVNDLKSGVGRRTNPGLFDRVLSSFGEFEKVGAHWFGRMIKSGDACNGCGWCQKNCPAGNIRLENNRPCFGKRCVFCLKCIYGCPNQALKPGVMKFAIIKDGYNLKALENRMAGVEPAPVEDLAKGFFWKGVRDYLLNNKQNEE